MVAVWRLLCRILSEGRFSGPLDGARAPQSGQFRHNWRVPRRARAPLIPKGWRRCLAIPFLSLPPLALAEWSTLNMPVGVTGQSREIYDLHMLIFWICVAIAVGVYSAMAWSLLVHRRHLGVKPAQFAHNTRLEIVWTVIPTLILVAMAIPSTLVLARIYDTTPGEVNIKVTGLQWKWKYDYLEEDFGFISNLRTPADEIEGRLDKGEFYLLDVDRPLYIPVGVKVRFLLTSDDVIHSFWLPDLGIKKDAIPGLFNVSWVQVDEPGVYHGVCAELCGQQHGFMPITVVAVEDDEYRAWVEERRSEQQELFAATQQVWDADALQRIGEGVYLQYCSACHGATGVGVPGIFPALAGSAVVQGEIAGQVNTVVNGVAGTAMQAFGDQLGAVDIAAAITYTRNAWGNSPQGERAVQPSQVHPLIEQRGQ